MNLRPALFALITTSAAMTSLAEEPLDGRIAPETLTAFVPASFEHEGFTLQYRLLSPSGIAEGEKRPLLLFLHGKGERGEENQRQLIHGGNVFAAEEFQQRHRAFVLAPQCPAGKEPGTVSHNSQDPPGTEADRVWTAPLSPGQTPTVDLTGEPTRQLAAAYALVTDAIETLPVDPDRVYVAGLSMGGYATWELAERYPERWAAAAPICGGGDPRHAARLTGLPLWAHHGEVDGVVPAERSRELIDAIQTAGGKPIYSEYPGVGHDSWTPSLGSRHLWDWMFAQRRGE